MADFLEEKRRELESRLNELKPLVEEHRRLEAALGALAGVDAPGTSAAKPARRTRRSSAPSSKSAGAKKSKGNGRRGRPKGSGTRGKQALEIITKRPGITIPELAEAMSIQQNYLYRVVPDLQKEGQVRKEGRGWHSMA